MAPRLGLLLCMLLAGPVEASTPLRVLAYSTQGFFVRDAQGVASGLEHDMLQYYARRAGRSLDITWVDRFEDLVPMLLAGKGDLISATMTVTPERQARVDFSAPYFTVQIRIVHRADHPGSDLAMLVGKRVGVIGGTTAEQALAGVHGVKVVRGQILEELFGAVARGELDALATDTSLALTYLQRFPLLRLGPPLSGEQHYAFAVAKGSPLREQMSQHVRDLKASGIYYGLLRKYLGEKAVAIMRAGRSER